MAWVGAVVPGHLVAQLSGALCGEPHVLPGLMWLAGPQQPHHQPYQLAGGEHEGPLVTVLAHFVKFALVIGGVLRVAHPHPVGRLAEVVVQVAIAGAGQSGLLGLEVRRLVLTPLEAGILGHSGLVVIETLDAGDLGDDTSGEDGAKAGDGIQRARDKPHPLRNDGVESLHLLLRGRNALEAQSQDQVDRLVEGFRQVIGVTGYALELAGVWGRIREASLAPAIDELRI